MNSFLKKILIFVAVMAVVAGAGWFGRKAYKKSMERRLVSQARQYLAAKDFHNASLSLQRALELNPVSADASDTMASLLEAAEAPAALNWRMRAAKLDSANMDKRFLWADLAVRANDPATATEALSGLDEKSKNTARYHKLMGAFAWSSHHSEEAEQHYLAAEHLEPENPAIQMNLATIRLVSTNQAVAQAAHAALEQLATNTALRSSALHELLTEATLHKSFRQAAVYSSQLAKDPAATPADKIGYLELLHQNQSSEYAAWLGSLEKISQTSADQAFALGRWKVVIDGPTNALHWMASLPPQIQTNLPVPLVMSDCQIAVKDWNGILADVPKQDWGEANYYKFALQSLAERSLSQNAAADVSWHRALRLSAHRLERLSRLADIIGAWGWSAEKSDVLAEIVDEFPGENWAVDQLAMQLYAQGKTSEMESLFFKVYSKDPSNPRLKN
ncbi:MAG TPA: hypothetical protein VH597_16405, partial [Verrucomicrobiae bacterium]|nr:hypothetical protein [Verrucomicrobiae bacterium]